MSSFLNFVGGYAKRANEEVSKARERAALLDLERAKNNLGNFDTFNFPVTDGRGRIGQSSFNFINVNQSGYDKQQRYNAAVNNYRNFVTNVKDADLRNQIRNSPAFHRNVTLPIVAFKSEVDEEKHGKNKIRNYIDIENMLEGVYTSKRGPQYSQENIPVDFLADLESWREQSGIPKVRNATNLNELYTNKDFIQSRNKNFYWDAKLNDGKGGFVNNGSKEYNQADLTDLIDLDRELINYKFSPKTNIDKRDIGKLMFGRASTRNNKGWVYDTLGQTILEREDLGGFTTINRPKKDDKQLELARQALSAGKEAHRLITTLGILQFGSVRYDTENGRYDAASFKPGVLLAGSALSASGWLANVFGETGMFAQISREISRAGKDGETGILNLANKYGKQGTVIDGAERLEVYNDYFKQSTGKDIYSHVSDVINGKALVQEFKDVATGDLISQEEILKLKNNVGADGKSELDKLRESGEISWTGRTQEIGGGVLDSDGVAARIRSVQIALAFSIAIANQDYQGGKAVSDADFERAWKQVTGESGAGLFGGAANLQAQAEIHAGLLEQLAEDSFTADIFLNTASGAEEKAIELMLGAANEYAFTPEGGLYTYGTLLNTGRNNAGSHMMLDWTFGPQAMAPAYAQGIAYFKDSAGNNRRIRKTRIGTPNTQYVPGKWDAKKGRRESKEAYLARRVDENIAAGKYDARD